MEFRVNQCPSAVFHAVLYRSRCAMRHSARVIKTLWSWNMPCSLRSSAMRKECSKHRIDLGYPARIAGGTNIQATLAIEGVAPLHAARTSQRDVATTLNSMATRPEGERQGAGKRLISPLTLVLLLLALFGSFASTFAAVVDYDIVYVRQPRYAPGIFAIPLQTPIANLPTQHITASVADLQGNTNVVTVRFRVDAGFRVLSLDASALNSQRLTLRFENPSGATNHIVLCVDDLAKPASAWTALNLLNAIDEPDQVRRLEVELPDGVRGNLFLRVQKPYP